MTCPGTVCRSAAAANIPTSGSPEHLGSAICRKRILYRRRHGKYPLTEHVNLQLNLYNLTGEKYLDQLHPSHVVPDRDAAP